LYNYSLEFKSFADLHQAAHSGQQRFKPYALHTWLGAFDDYFATLERDGGATNEALKLEELRAKLRGWIRRGWRRMGSDFNATNLVGCREDLPSPSVRGDQWIDQVLPDDECGQPTACKLQSFIQTQKLQMEKVAAGLEAIPESRKDKETKRRIRSLRNLLGTVPGTPFVGKECHYCGDAIICLEAPPGCVIATKNRKHFEPLAEILAKPLTIAESARTTKLGNTRR
jgi:hypothetical protein